MKTNVSMLLPRFRETHQRLATALEAYSSEVPRILAEVDCTRSHPTELNHGERLDARSNILEYLQDVRRIVERFVQAMREELTFGVWR